MKALIVIEIPEDHFLVTTNDLYERLKGYKCDLKPMPEKKELANYLPFEDYPQQIRFMDFVNGWNDCIEEIEG